MQATKTTTMKSTIGTCTVTAAIAPGPAPGKDQRGHDLLDVWIDGLGAETKYILLLLPIQYNEEEAESIRDTSIADGAAAWTVTYTTDDEWVIELKRGEGEASKQTLHFKVPITRATSDKALTGAKMRLGAGSKTDLPSIPVRAAGDWAVELTSDPKDLFAVAYGTEITLSWTLHNIVEKTAFLRGSFIGASRRPAVVGETATVWALQATDYTLEATVMVDGVPRQVTRSVRVAVELPQTGMRMVVRPNTVLPGGPSACFYTAVNVTMVNFAISSSTGGKVVSLANHGKPSGQLGSLVDRSFTTHFGPSQHNEKWSISVTSGTSRASAPTVDKQKVEEVTVATAAAVEPASPWGSETVHGFVAGQFAAELVATRPVANAGGRVTVEWVAVATAQGLEVQLFWASDQAPRVERHVKFAGMMCRGVTHAGDAEDMRTVVVAVQDGAALQLQALELPAMTNVGARLNLDPELQGSTQLRLLALGDRVYVLGAGIAGSYARKTSTGYTREPWLSKVATPAWQVVAVPGAAGSGWLFALDRTNGALLRFDLRADATDGSLEAPRELAAPNHRLAKLDLLQRAQLGNSEYWSTNGAYNLGPASGKKSEEKSEEKKSEEKKSEEKKSEEKKRTIWRDDPGCIDEQSVLLVAGGALVVRCTRGDPGHRDNPLQDRVYDPRLNVWGPCGHLFPNTVEGGGHFAATRLLPKMIAFNPNPTPNKDKGPPKPLPADLPKRPVSAEGSFYHRRNGALWRVHGELLDLLGFAGLNMTPIAATSLPAPLWRTNVLAAGDKLTAEQYLQSPNGKYRLGFEATGHLVLAENDGQTWTRTNPPPSTDERGTSRPKRKLLWETTTTGAAPELTLQANDGNLVVYSTTNGSRRDLWGGHDHGAVCGSDRAPLETAAALQGLTVGETAAEYAGSRLVLEDDGRLELRSSSGILLWRAPRTFVGEFPAGEWLFRADTLKSQDGSHSFANKCDWAMARLGTDGHLRLYGRSSTKPIWSTEQYGGRSWSSQHHKLVVENNGDTAVRDHGYDSPATMWHSANFRGPSGTRLQWGEWFESPGGEYRLVLQPNLNLVLYDRAGTKVWETNSNGSGGPLHVAENGDLGGPGWWASANGGVCDGPYRGCCGGIEMTARGFQVVSTSPATVWYDVTDDGGFPPAGKVRRRNSRRCRIYNEAQKGYMFAAANWRYHKDSRWRGVFVGQDGGAGLDNIWVVSEVQAGRFAIYNEHHKEWLLATQTVLTIERPLFGQTMPTIGVQLLTQTMPTIGGQLFDAVDTDRRNIFATNDDNAKLLASHGEGFFALALHAGNTTIQSLAMNEYVYADESVPVDFNCRVLSWIPRGSDGNGLLVNNGVWQLQDV